MWAPDFIIWQLGDGDNPYSLLSLSFLKLQGSVIVVYPSLRVTECSALGKCHLWTSFWKFPLAIQP